MKGHSDEMSLASLLNCEADYYASRAQKVVDSVHPAPIFIDYFLTKALSEDLQLVTSTEWPCSYMTDDPHQLILI
jgi:hypothetical protein